MRSRLAILLATVVLGSASAAHAGLFDDDEARARLDAMRKEVDEHFARIDTAAATTTRNQIDLSNQIEQIKADLAKLRGQIEVLGYEVESAQKRQKDFYLDLDGRLRKIEAVAAAKDAAPAENAAAAAPADPAAEMRDFENALTHFKSARYKEALAAFDTFIKDNPKSTLLPSATFWAASSHYQLRAYAKAAELFGKVAATWPADPKAADAMLGQANSLQEAGDAKEAKKVLEQLLARYPNSSAAQAARPRLKKK